MNYEFSVLKGMVLSKIIGGVGDEIMIFETDCGERYKLFYTPECCEQVYIEDICGDLNDIIHSEILLAEKVESDNKSPIGVKLPKRVEKSYLWTFYKLSTIRGSVTIRWFGTSNGGYSESVDFDKMDDDEVY